MSQPSSASSEWAPPDVDELNRLLPQYEIEAIIGRGGMGAVYKGRQVALDRIIAIKLLPETLQSGDDEMNFVERFKLEARSMASLDHPAIISVFDFGQTAEGHLYFVMEFVDGMDIDRYIQLSGGKVPFEHAVAIVSHVLDALAYAHSRGIMHRDIKPANILINREGKVKIADFGLAKKTSAEETAAMTGLTLANVTMGTPDYIAPECLDSNATPDARSDLYSVGVMLYQMLTGKIPRGIFNLPSRVDSSLDSRFDEIITRAMAGDPDERYGTADEFRGELDQVLSAPVIRIDPSQSTGAIEAPAEKFQFTEPGLRRSASMRKHAATPAVHGVKKLSSRLIVATVASLVSVSAIAWFFLGSTEETSTSSLTMAATPPPVAATPPAPAPGQLTPGQAASPLPAAAQNQAPSTVGPGQWPTGPNYQSAGHFRAWSSIPDDPAINLDPLREITDIRQVYLNVDGWIVLRESGEILSRNGGANGRKNIRRIAHGWVNYFGLIDRDGKLEEFPPRNEPFHQQPEDLGPVKDAYLSIPYRAAILENGDFITWGMGFDGVKNEPGQHEWVVRPALPPGRKAVAMSSSDFSTALLLDDGSLRAWHINFGELKLAPDFGPGKIIDFAVNRNWLHAVPRSGGQGIVMNFNGNPDTAVKFGSPWTPRFFSSADEGILMVPEEGTATMDNSNRKRFTGLLEALYRLTTSHKDLVSVQIVPGKTPLARIFWFDGPATTTSAPPSNQSLTKAPESPETEAARAAASANSPASAAAGPPPPSILSSHPDFLLRVGNYQKARQQKVGDLAAKYQNALKNALTEASRSGNLAHVEVIQEALVRGGDLTAEISGLPANPVVNPLKTLPALGDETPESLRRLRQIFDTELNRIETELLGALDQSLEVLQANLVKSASIELAKELQAHRGQLQKTFAPVIQTETALTATPVAAPATQSANAGGNSGLESATKDRPFLNRLGMKFVPVPNTKILMCIHETRRSDYEIFAEKNPGTNPDWRTASDRGNLVSTEPDHPVVMVNRDSALRFCEWLSKEEEIRYRLPTDREWSWAVGIGAQESEDATPAALNRALEGVYPWGTEWPPRKNNLGNYSDQSYRELFPRAASVPDYKDGFALIAPVMSFPPNALGIHDLDGNVWEWCQDFFDATEGDTGLARGSSWSANNPNQMLSSHRQVNRPGTQSPAGGFRVVIDLGEPGEVPISPERRSSAVPLPEPDAEGWISLFNGTDLLGWRPATAASWSVKDGELWKVSGVPDNLDRIIPQVEFEMTGEFRVSEGGNGGIIFPFVAEVELIGSQGRGGVGVKTAGIIGHARQRDTRSTPDRNPISDDRWTAFRIRMTRTLLETWLDDKQIASLALDRNGHRETTINLQGLNNGGEVAYRGLRMRPISGRN